MAHLDTSKLKLVRVEPDRPRNPDREYDPRLQYDPHLLEEKRRADSDQTPTIGITTEEDGNRFVDVIAKLKDPEKEVNLLEVVANPGHGQIVTGKAPISDIEDIHEDDNVISLKAAIELHLHLHHSVSAIHCDPVALDKEARDEDGTYPGLDGTGVVVGVVDVGCDFRHMNFRQPSGATRIRFLWDQTGDRTEQSPQPYGYGRELTAEAINQALLAGEEKAYRALGYTPPVAAHGTHVLDIAAGSGREPGLFGGKQGAAPARTSRPGVAPNAVLIFVQLKSFENGFLGNSRHLLEAVDYIFRKADDLKMPAVVNLSLSTSGGPHDGTTLVEQGFEALLEEKPGRAIVVSAGNSYKRQSHLSGKVTKGEITKIFWHTDPDHADPETTKNEMEIWYPGGKKLEVTVCTPDDKPLGPVALGETKDLCYDVNRGSGRRVGRISHREKDPNNSDNQIDIRLPHLENVPGPWKIELKTENGGVELHAWIEQGGRGRSRFEGPTDPQYTLGSISCNAVTLTVGAFDTSENACMVMPYEATSAGPTRRIKKAEISQKMDKPDLSAPGVNIVAARSQGGITVKSGTSMAAAHVTGLVALLFQLALRAGKGLLPFSTTRQVLTDAARKGPQSWASALDPARFGAGTVHGGLTVAALLDLPAEQPIEEPRPQAAQRRNVIAAAQQRPNGKRELEEVRALLNTFRAELEKGTIVRLTTEAAGPPS